MARWKDKKKMSIKPLIASLIILHFFLCPLFAFALELKGIEVDKKADCEHINSLEIRKGEFYDACKNRTEEFIQKISFLDDDAWMALKQTKKGIVELIQVTNFDFEKALVSLKAKYGEPEINKNTVQNPYGATFDQVTAIWKEGEELLILKKHSGEINHPSLTLHGKTLKKESKKQMEPSSDI